MAEGNTSPRLNKSCVLLIVIAGMERFAFKGVASNLVTYLTSDMGMSNSTAAKFVNSWVGFTSMLPLVVATLADTYWQRYPTIVASSLLYAAGLLALTSTAVQWPWITTTKVHSVPSLLWSLCMISLGQGGYNPSLQAFGADQLENEHQLPQTNNNDDEQSSSKKSLFFQWWYFGVCCGSLLGVSVMSYIQDTLGWGLGFAIPTFAMVISIIMFLFGNRFYIRKESRSGDDRTAFEDVVRAIKKSVWKMFNGGKMSSKEYAVVELELEEKVSFTQQPDPNITCDQEHVHPAKIVIRMLPIWVMLLMFAVIFQQPATFFTKQGMTMKRNVIGTKFKIPPAALQSAITVSIIILMPWYDSLFIPLVRIFTHNDKGISIMQRMGIGMFLSVIAMVIAAITETKRLELTKSVDLGSQEVALSIFWLLPQYILLGISDIFTVVGMQEYFYSEVPVRMRTVGIALYTSVFGVGSFLSAFLICVIEYFTRGNNWFDDDMTKARLDKYYWFLALSSAFSLLAFITFCKVCTSSTKT